MISWKDWLSDISGHESNRKIASRILFSPSSVAAWNRTGNPPVEAVIECARVYDADYVVGLVVAGILTVEDIQRDVERRLTFVPTRLLLAELVRRDESGGDGINHALAPEWE